MRYFEGGLPSPFFWTRLFLKKLRGLELVTSFSLSYKICLEKVLFLVIYHLGNFDDLIQSGFWVIPKILFPNFCKPIQDVIIIPVSSDPVNMVTVKRKGEALEKLEYLENKKTFLVEKKSTVRNFWNAFFR